MTGSDAHATDASSASAAPAETSFEADLAALEAIVTQMETGDLTLADSLAAFERGIRLVRTCQDALTQAEQRVQVLLGEGADARLEPFSDPAGHDRDA